jgi:DNA-binding PadR family transcriptional regulator
VGNLWSVQHAQLYTEPERLAGAGLVQEERESGGRRRRMYTITDEGRRALAEWLATPVDSQSELRDPGLLQLFFGAEPAAIAPPQLAVHQRKLEEYLDLHRAYGEKMARGERLALEAGIAHEREWLRFWGELQGDANHF